jgi:hypothetical protein
MDRRELLKMIVAATGTAFVGSSAFAYDLTTATALNKTGFSALDIALINEIGEAIIPKTDTPGAKEADVGSAIAVIVADCYSEDEQKLFKQGLVEVQKTAQSEYGKKLAQLSATQRTALLSGLDTLAKQYNLVRQNGDIPHYFTLFKQLVIFTFFTSKKGANEALRFVAIPGRYDGDYPYKKGDKAWAT